MNTTVNGKSTPKQAVRTRLSSIEKQHMSIIDFFCFRPVTCTIARSRANSAELNID